MPSFSNSGLYVLVIDQLDVKLNNRYSRLINLLKDVLEPPIVLLQDGARHVSPVRLLG
jgi:hypothetical protein